MVDFNNETTTTIPALNVERILVLEKREYFINAVESHDVVAFKGASFPINVMRARLKSLFLQLQAFIKRRLGDKDYLILRDKVFNTKDYDELLLIFESISELLDSIKLTTIDTRKAYDSTDVEEENTIKGF